jgi:hypothetical protein
VGLFDDAPDPGGSPEGLRYEGGDASNPGSSPEGLRYEGGDAAAPARGLDVEIVAEVAAAAPRRFTRGTPVI